MRRRMAAVCVACSLMVVGADSQNRTKASSSPSANQVAEIYPEVEALYLDLHQHPELSFHEQQTAAKLTDRIKALGYEVTTNVGGTGIAAILRNGDESTVLLRTDMDALPVQEKTDLPYASKVTTTDDLVRPSRSCMLAATISTCRAGTGQQSSWLLTSRAGTAR